MEDRHPSRQRQVPKGLTMTVIINGTTGTLQNYDYDTVIAAYNADQAVKWAAYLATRG